jgi:transposase-like protein
MLEKSEKEQFWRLVLEEYARSGLSAREYCRRETISEPSFYAWRRKIHQRDTQARIGSELVPVNVLKSGTTARLSPSRSRSDSSLQRESGLEIVSTGGDVLRVDDSCSVDVIRRALVAIRLSADESLSC